MLTHWTTLRLRTSVHQKISLRVKMKPQNCKNVCNTQMYIWEEIPILNKEWIPTSNTEKDRQSNKKWGKILQITSQKKRIFQISINIREAVQLLQSLRKCKLKVTRRSNAPQERMSEIKSQASWWRFKASGSLIRCGGIVIRTSVVGKWQDRLKLDVCKF